MNIDVRRIAPLTAAVGIPALLFLVLPPLGHAGLWDPHELRLADAAQLHIDPLAAPPLALWSVAASFKVFGVHDWAGRLPFALYGVLGAVALYAAVARLVDRRAGLYAALALATMPLYFVQARALLGGVVGMSAVAAAFGALTVASFDRASRRPAWLGLTVVALGGGFLGAGALLGVAVPCAGVGVAWALVRVTGDRPRDLAGDAIGGGALAVGALATAATAWALAKSSPHAALFAGAVPGAATHLGFDRVLAHVGHQLAPWSAFAPLALGRLFLAPPVEDPAARVRESDARVAILVAAATALAAHAWLIASGVDLPFVAPAVLAAACALALRDFERGAPTSILVGAATAIFAAILLIDFRAAPEETLEPFAVGAAAMPEAFRSAAQRGWGIALAVFAASALATWVERDVDRKLFDRARLVRTARAAAGEWDGNAGRVYLVVTVGAAFAAAAVTLGARWHMRWALNVATPVRDGISLVAVLLLLGPPIAFAIVPVACDAAAWLSSRVFRGGRGGILIAGGLASGLVLSAWQYPALAAELSPKGALDAYARAHKDGEPLALLGVSERAMATGAYGGQAAKAESFATPSLAYAWLEGAAPTATAGPEIFEPGPVAAPPRRFLLAATGSLPGLNRVFRERSPAPHINAPVLDARSADVVLVVSSLAPGETSANPFDAETLTAPPAPQHPLEVDLSGQVAILGWDILDDHGARADNILAGRKYKVRTYLRVDQTPTTAWQAFVHFDGDGRRQNADHALLDGKYPPTSWVPGDLLVDTWELALAPNFTPGRYTIYYGFYQGGSRLAVKSGPHDNVDRVDLGAVVVR